MLIGHWAKGCLREQLRGREKEMVGFLAMVRDQCKSAMAEAENEHRARQISTEARCASLEKELKAKS